jgi:hypothetical protein
MQRTEWLLGRPWLVVLVVAVFIVLPVLALGELSANDSRARLRSAELDGLAKTADRAVASATDSIDTIRRQMKAASETPVSGKPTALLLALQGRDLAGLDAFTAYLDHLMTPQVLRIWVDSEVGRGSTFTFKLPFAQLVPANAT